LRYFFLKYGVHHHLEGGGRIGKAEEHYRWFKQSFWYEEGCFPLISIFNTDVVVSPSHVKFGEQ
jgi:hypothetical protein